MLSMVRSCNVWLRLSHSCAKFSIRGEELILASSLHALAMSLNPRAANALFA